MKSKLTCESDTNNHRFFEDSLIFVQNIKEIRSQIKNIKAILQKNNLTVIRGGINSIECKTMINSLIDNRKKLPIIQGRRSKNDLLRESIKYAVGGTYYHPRALEIFYCPLGRNKQHTKVSLKLIKVRNIFYGQDENFASKANGEYFTLPRVHRYPRGGGFMAPHVDIEAPNATKDIEDSPYYVVSLCLSKHGEDYEQGGGYIVRDSKIYNFDKYTLPGDIVIYTRKTCHGVLEVDPERVLVWEKKGGRSYMFVMPSKGTGE